MHLCLTISNFCALDCLTHGPSGLCQVVNGLETNNEEVSSCLKDILVWILLQTEWLDSDLYLEKSTFYKQLIWYLQFMTTFGPKDGLKTDY